MMARTPIAFRVFLAMSMVLIGSVEGGNFPCTRDSDCAYCGENATCVVAAEVLAEPPLDVVLQWNRVTRRQQKIVELAL